MSRIPSLRPTAEELIEAAREHIVTKVIPTIADPQLRFQTLVAAHVLGVVGRELSAGTGPFKHVQSERAGLPGGPESDGALCESIRAGAFDAEGEGAALREHLRMRTELALMAWNPMFLMRVKSGG